MDWGGLQNFFVMHGENLDRKQGNPGRGLFGTGKSAAFGIADTLRITTVRAGLRSIVELSRADIQAMDSEAPIPVRAVEREVLTASGNGTLIEIEGIHLSSLDQAAIIHYIERHLAHWPKGGSVYVNNHECEFAEPPVETVKRFRPDGQAQHIVGDIELLLKVSKAPLDEDLRGVAIFSNGVWHETTLAGSEGREMSQYIFGELDVPKLDEDTSPMRPFDVTRSMQLNPNNETVRAIYGFIGVKVEEVRRELAEAERKRKATDEARKLAEQASVIARVINEDFIAFRQRIARAKAFGTNGPDLGGPSPAGREGREQILPGSEIPAVVVARVGGTGSSGGSGGNGGGPRSLGPILEPGPPDAQPIGRPAGTSQRSVPRGGFEVKFDHMGPESPRAQYVREERTIYINLDHPQLTAAVGLGTTEDPVFRRLPYEIAFSEYAIALASELAAQDEYLDPSDPIVDIRDTLNRVARAGALLYSA